MYDYIGALPSNIFRNHKGALDFPSAVDSFVLVNGTRIRFCLWAVGVQSIL